MCWNNQLHECYQSACHPIILLRQPWSWSKMTFFEAFDNRQGVILVLLDQSAAFDTIDHSMLVSRLQRRFGITGVASAWIESCLSGRSQSVVLSGNTSHSTNLPQGVPQKVTVGPSVVHLLYVSQLGISFVVMTCAFSCTQMILRSTSVSSLLTGKSKWLLYIRWNIVWPRFVTPWRGIILR